MHTSLHRIQPLVVQVRVRREGTRPMWVERQAPIGAGKEDVKAHLHDDAIGRKWSEPEAPLMRVTSGDKLVQVKPSKQPREL